MGLDWIVGLGVIVFGGFGWVGVVIGWLRGGVV